jgi:CHC2 zinc finger
MRNIKSPQIAATKRVHQTYTRTYSIKNRYRRTFDPSLLPNPADYYKQQFPNIKPKLGWVQVQCCFHDDRHPSLSINLFEGNFICFACGAKGRDIVAFHMLLNGLTFVEAVTFFGAWRHG